MSKCIRQITMTSTVRLDGSDGSTRYFIKNDQYCFTNIVVMNTGCESCDESFKYRKRYAYEVVVDEETYYVPEDVAVMDSTKFPDKYKSAYAYWEQRNYQPADWKKVYKEMTGIDVDKNIIFNGEEIARKHRGNGSIENAEQEQFKLHPKKWEELQQTMDKAFRNP